ncbi:multi-sensor signal transduction histidine kinase [Thalassoporum mexicanum PCC 7367]|uniref:PAS domain S-box protein n=1 Tax=Thalassoporum mexicanum TaxID=3457544 RepID=UPI00029FACBC|nr:PAS domain S-box protein [Pseudanabaena sp. PCC 7367]AFY69132.1 multi-sensor signal transduction histidine kinase [Pseudanabaena sp. PCC 7367]
MNRVLNHHLEAIRDCCINDAAFEKVKQILEQSAIDQLSCEPDNSPDHLADPNQYGSLRTGTAGIYSNNTRLEYSGQNGEKPDCNEQAQHRSRALLNAIPDLIFRFNRQGIYTDVLAKQESDLALPADQLIGSNIYAVLPEHLADRFIEMLELAIASGDTQTFEYELEINGQLRCWEARLVASGSDEVTSIVRETTAQRRVQEALQRNEARTLALLDAIPDLMFRISRDGTYLDFKAHRDSDFAISPSKMLGHKVHDVLPQEIADRRMEQIERAFQTGKTQIFEYQLEKHNSIHEYEARVVVSGVDEVLVIVRDITERKQAEIALRRSEEKFSKSFHSSPNLIVIATLTEGKILEVNDTTAKMLGYRCDQLVNQSLVGMGIWVDPEDGDRLRHQLQTQGTVKNFESKLCTKSGDRIACLISAEIIFLHNSDCMLAIINDISDRKRIEEQLLQTTSNLRAIFEAFPDLQFRLDAAGQVLEYHSGSTSELFVKPEQFMHRQIEEFLPPQIAKKTHQAIQETIATQALVSYEYNLPIQGCDRIFEARMLPFQDEQVIVIVRDITERVEAERALRLSEEMFSKAFRSNPDSCSISTFNEGKFIEINQAFLDTTNYQRDEVINHTATELGIWHNPAEALQLRQTLQEKGFVRNVEYEFCRKSGEPMLALFSAELIEFNGESCILAMTNDITDRKLAEARLKEAIERDRLLGEIALKIRRSLNLDQILHTAVTEVRQMMTADRVFIAYANGENQSHVIAESVDLEWPSVLGWVADDALTKEVEVMFRSGKPEIIDDLTQVSLSPNRTKIARRSKVKAALTVPILLGDRLMGILGVHQCTGTRHWHTFEVNFLEKLATQVAIAIQQAELYAQVQDLNANLEQQVQERTEELEQRYRELQELSEVKDFFIHAVSHDLRTPIMGNLLLLRNLIKKGTESCVPIAPSVNVTTNQVNQAQGTLNQTSIQPPPQSPTESKPVSKTPTHLLLPLKILDRMVQSSDRQLEMLNLLLDAHALEAGNVALKSGKVGIACLVKAVLADLEPLLSKNQAKLNNLISDDLPSVAADMGQIVRVYENLITNSLKHNPPGMELTLDAQPIETEQGAMLRCEIKDNGLGMADCGKLFQRYAKTDRSKYSTNISLSLYLCRQIISAHGGQIGVANEAGQGTTFWFTLAIAPQVGMR